MVPNGPAPDLWRALSCKICSATTPDGRPPAFHSSMVTGQVIRTCGEIGRFSKSQVRSSWPRSVEPLDLREAATRLPATTAEPGAWPSPRAAGAARPSARSGLREIVGAWPSPRAAEPLGQAPTISRRPCAVPPTAGPAGGPAAGRHHRWKRSCRSLPSSTTAARRASLGRRRACTS